jgi:tRNA G18 (ribose-2'-O)-methylase SpoU
MRGYFAIGAERISKPLNVGNLMRSAHAFGASFFFTVNAQPRAVDMTSDTSKALTHLPYYNWANPDEMVLPKGCKLVGVELLENAAELPSFRHPLQAAYILGPERGELSAPILARCDHIVKIPAAFCINVAMAGAIVMYDRLISLGRFMPRPVFSGAAAPGEILPPHVAGASFRRTEAE